MSLCRNGRRSASLCIGLLLTLFVVALPTVGWAQIEKESKYDIFVGYQWVNPGGSVPSGALDANGLAIPYKVPSISPGFGLAGAYNFSRNWAMEVDYGGNFNDRATLNTLSAGPRYMWRGEGINIFAHTLLGLNRISPKNLASSSGIGAILGGGIDLPLREHFSWRLIEADYLWSRHNYADETTASDPLRRTSFEGARLRTGLVYDWGGEFIPPAAVCSVQKSEVMVGEPIAVSVTTTNFNPKHTLTYNWASTGGRITGAGTGASVDTTGMAGGSFTATARVTDPKSKRGGEASCSANFTVKELPKNPPTMSCSANPTSVDRGGSSTITCTCTSPDSATVSVGNWTTNGGNIAGNGDSAVLNTGSANPGPITVGATCTDSRGLTSPLASATVNVNAPPPPPAKPKASNLGSCQFNNKMKPWRVDNTCKATLDGVAAAAQKEADAKVVVVGNSDATERRKNLAAERAVNAKAYLSGGEGHQGIDANRIQTRTGNAGTQSIDTWLVPTGADDPAPDAKAVDESMVKVVGDKTKAAGHGMAKGAKKTEKGADKMMH